MKAPILRWNLLRKKAPPHCRDETSVGTIERMMFIWLHACRCFLGTVLPAFAVSRTARMRSPRCRSSGKTGMSAARWPRQSSGFISMWLALEKHGGIKRGMMPCWRNATSCSLCGRWSCGTEMSPSSFFNLLEQSCSLWSLSASKLGTVTRMHIFLSVNCPCKFCQLLMLLLSGWQDHSLKGNNEYSGIPTLQYANNFYGASSALGLNLIPLTITRIPPMSFTPDPPTTWHRDVLRVGWLFFEGRVEVLFMQDFPKDSMDQLFELSSCWISQMITRSQSLLERLHCIVNGPRHM